MECDIPSCNNSAARERGGRSGLCSTHYQRIKRHGDPDIVKTLRPSQMPWLNENKSFDSDECLIWPFYRSPEGYGRCHMVIDGKRYLTTASRAMLIVSAGEPPTPRHEAAHSCGNGHLGCVNPKHLRWATSKENSADQFGHGTTNRGERHGRSKLSLPLVKNILRSLKTETQTSIAKRLGIHQSTISQIASGKRWGWIDRGND